MNYECTFICSPDLDTVKVEETVAKASKIVESANGKIKNLQQLGKKKLAYNINKFREGIYVYMELEGDGAMVQTLENAFKVSDNVIRYLTVKVEAKKKKVKVAKKKVEKPAEVKAVEENKAESENESAQLSDTTTK